VIPQFRELPIYMTRKPDERCGARWAPGGEPIVLHLSNLPASERITDASRNVRVGRAKMPATSWCWIGDGPSVALVEVFVRKKKLAGTTCTCLGKQDQVIGC